MKMATTTTTTSSSSSTSLNDLSEELLLHIISFIPTQEVIKTSLISRRFRQLWSSLPNLSLSHCDFSPPNQTLASTRHSFIQLVNHTLFHRSLFPPLRRFRLQFRLNERQHTGPITTWISHAIALRVTELDINLSDGPNYEHLDHGDVNWGMSYDFPFALLRASHVRELKLCHCDISQNLYGIQIISLRSLFLGYVTLTDEGISDLISGCINLEFLTLDLCFGMQNMKIHSSKLKELTLQGFQSNIDDISTSLEIVSPNLTSLKIIDFVVDAYVLKDIVSLVEADVRLPYGHYSKVIKLVAHVKRLHVFNYWFQLLKAKDFFPKSTILFNLNYLHMITWYSKSDLLGLAAFLELTPNLDTMILVRELNFDGNGKMKSDEVIDEQIKFNLPSLRQVTMKYYGKPMNELYLMELLKQQGVVLEKVELIPARW